MRRHLFETRRDVRRGDVLSNVVWFSGIAVLLISAGSLTGLFSPWTDSSLSGVDRTSHEEIWSTEASGRTPATNVANVSPHAFFGFEDEGVSESPSKVIRAEHVAGNWSTPVDNDCSDAPKISITLREGMTDVFGFGTIALNACDDDIKYAVVEGTILEGRVVLTITNDTAGKLLYTFEGTLTDDDLVGNLTANGGRSTASIVLSRS